ncbi:sensor histidine kinase [Chitinophaga sp. RCC_12]|uniref:sensor histidine kinase n=1 Tax=Chitinophaga sp. RCC_12 TaxID=3239226 RepID=UPI003525B9B0
MIGSIYFEDKAWKWPSALILCKHPLLFCKRALFNRQLIFELMSKANIRIVGIHIVIVITLIIFEFFSLHITGANFNPVVIGVFYFYNVIFFYFISFGYLPYLEKKFSDILIVIDLLLFILLIYCFISGVIALLLEYVFFDLWNIKVAIRLSILLLSRGLLFFCAALAYWFAMYSIRKANDAKEQELLRHEAEKREVVMESQFLRSQLDTHLMGNMLNTVYSAIQKTVPDQAEIILLAADTLTYCARHNDESGRVTLHEDMGQLNRIIKLRQAIGDNRLQVIFSTDIRGKDNAIRIPPLLFSDLVENVFKYGNLHDPDSPARIKISVLNQVLYFRSWNKHVPGSKLHGNGIGLANTRQRLQKHYGDAHNLSVENNEDYFLVELNIRL